MAGATGSKPMNYSHILSCRHNVPMLLQYVIIPPLFYGMCWFPESIWKSREPTRTLIQYSGKKGKKNYEYCLRFQYIPCSIGM